MKQKLIRATALTMSMLMLGVTALTGCSNQEQGKTTESSTTEASTAKDTETGTQVSSSETGNKPEVPDNFNEEGLPILKRKRNFHNCSNTDQCPEGSSRQGMCPGNRGSYQCSH